MRINVERVQIYVYLDLYKLIKLDHLHMKITYYQNKISVG